MLPSFLSPERLDTKLSRVGERLFPDDPFPWSKKLRNKGKTELGLPKLNQCMFQSPMSFPSNVDGNRCPQKEIAEKIVQKRFWCKKDSEWERNI